MNWNFYYYKLTYSFLLVTFALTYLSLYKLFLLDHAREGVRKQAIVHDHLEYVQVLLKMLRYFKYFKLGC